MIHINKILTDSYISCPRKKMNDLKVSVIIPAFNEALTIGGLVDAIKTRHPGYEVIVINDGSRDDTAGVAIAAGATVYSHPYNIGNGAAIKSGIRIASGEIIFGLLVISMKLLVGSQGIW